MHKKSFNSPLEFLFFHMQFLFWFALAIILISASLPPSLYIYPLHLSLPLLLSLFLSLSFSIVPSRSPPLSQSLSRLSLSASVVLPDAHRQPMKFEKPTHTAPS